MVGFFLRICDLGFSLGLALCVDAHVMSVALIFYFGGVGCGYDIAVVILYYVTSTFSFGALDMFSTRLIVSG